MPHLENSTAKETLAERIVQRCFDAHPELPARYGRKGRMKCLQDTRFHLQYLFEAVANQSPRLFIDYVAWAKIMLLGVKVPEKDLIQNLEAIRSELLDDNGEDGFPSAREYVDQAISAVPTLPSELPSFIAPNKPYFSVASKYLELLLSGDRREASKFILEQVAAGMTIKNIYLHVFQPAQHEIGRLWQTNRLSVAQEHFCTAATQLIMSQLYSKIFSTRKIGYRMVATCVGSELHEIGVRMVADFFEMEGWDTFYLGANTPAPSVIQTIVDQKAHLLALSATMTFHVDQVSKIIQAVRAESRLSKLKILVGGYPFNVDSQLWKKLGADGYSSNAEESIELALKLVK